jgi:hypothetical protein
MFVPHSQAEARKESATKLIKHLLALEEPEVLTAHLRELLTVLLWKLTEAESTKYKTRFRTEGAIACTDKTRLRHEHPFQRKKMIAALEKASPDEIDSILVDAIGCTVTVEEHASLSQFDHEYGCCHRHSYGGAFVLKLSLHS